ncbi:MAG: FG-GAP-like repeat-containing protein [Pseudomonadota bacterium]
MRGPLSGDLSLADADARLAGASANDYSGYPVTGAGDLDADGYADVLVASLGAALAGSGPGRAHLFRGAFSGHLDLDEADAILTGESDGDYAGQGLCRAGDLDGDGRDDLLLGAPRHQVPAFGGGAVYVFFEMPQGSVSLAAADEVLAGEHAQDLAGQAVGSVPDGDGAALLVGAPGYQDGRARGAAYLIQVE